MNILEYIYSEIKERKLSSVQAKSLIEEYIALQKTPAKQRLSPLVHVNNSTANQLIFTSEFSGHEFFFEDHQLLGTKVLPGVAHLEMARVAAETALNRRGQCEFHNVTWVSPIGIYDTTISIKIAVYPQGDSEAEFEIFGIDREGDNVLFSEGRISITDNKDLKQINVSELNTVCFEENARDIYALFQQAGLEYGPSHQGVKKIRKGTDKNGHRQVLAELELAETLKDSLADYVLHPGLMDSALQAAIGLYLNEEFFSLAIPYALNKVRVYQALPAKVLVWVRFSTDHSDMASLDTLDISLMDTSGKVCVELEGLLARKFNVDVFSRPSQQIVKESHHSLFEAEPVFFQARWEAQEPNKELKDNFFSQHHVLLLGEFTEKALAGLQGEFSSSHVIQLNSDRSCLSERYSNIATTMENYIALLIRGATSERLHIQMVINANTSLASRGLEGYESHQATNFANTCYTGLSRLLNTLSQKHVGITIQCIEIYDRIKTQTLIERLRQDLDNASLSTLRYLGGQRQATCLQAVAAPVLPASNTIWNQQGIYILFGSMTPVEIALAKAISEKVNDPVIIFVGQAPLSAEQGARLEELSQSNATMEYHCINFGDPQALMQLVAEIEKRRGSVNGVFYCEDERQNLSSNNSSLSLPVSVINVDSATQNQKLDFFVCLAIASFNETAPVMMSGFADAYMDYRNTLVSSSVRAGSSLSVYLVQPTDDEQFVNDRAVAQILAFLDTGVKGRLMGMYKSLEKNNNANKDTEKYAEKLTGQNIPTVRSNKELPQGDAFELAVYKYFVHQFSSMLKLPAERIDITAPMEDYGFDSMMVSKLTNILEEKFGSLSKALFFEVRTIQEVADHFIQNYSGILQGLVQTDSSDSKAVIFENTSTSIINHETYTETSVLSENEIKTQTTRNKRAPRDARMVRHHISTQAQNSDIAIIGLSGRYASSDSLGELWSKLVDGADCISEIPKQRWDNSKFFDGKKGAEGKTYSKWGGFISGVDEFDAKFFNVSPVDAMFIDPQERLFLQCVYETIEDAGYTRENLLHNVLAINNVGVFVGVMYSEYQLFGAQAQALGQGMVLPGNPASIANRISYYYNFHGPSMAVDTMCSSSLTAIHLACENINKGLCEVAIAGGVNVSIHPNKYLLLSQGQFTASNGRCVSFGEGGDGYVPGEGVGAVLLKPLHKAISDNDHIYGVIKGSAVNHGGKTNGYTVPNPLAQAAVIENALSDADVDPRTLSYVEAHGTGTPLGDPIEIAGLTRAFGQYTKDTQYCAIGSVKSNIGHCESAAGIAGVSKVLLQMKHRKLVPSLHSEQLNRNIDFSRTPFVVQQSLADWPRPVIEHGVERKEYPRRATVSSFGAGGSNACVVLEEYVAPARETVSSRDLLNSVAIVLSARTEAALKQRVERLLADVQELVANQESGNDTLVRIAYTLQTGREAMRERLGFVVNSVVQLQEKLTHYLQGHTLDNLYQGKVVRGDGPALTQAGNHEVGTWLEQKNYRSLLSAWVTGQIIAWEGLYGSVPVKRISLSAYPFAKERYWAPDSIEKAGSYNARHEQLHPLLHRNTSRFDLQRFSTVLRRDEFYLSDHQLKGACVLPGVAYLEMARAAVLQSSGMEADEAVVLLSNITWLRPAVVGDQPLVMHIDLTPQLNQQGGDSIGLSIYSGSLDRPNDEDKGGKHIYSQGIAQLLPVMEAPQVDVQSLQQSLAQSTLTVPEYYDCFKSIGLEYGSAFRGVEALYTDGSQVLARVRLPQSVAASGNDFYLHPSVMDAALQATALLIWQDESPSEGIPFALESAEIYGACRGLAWAWARYSPGSSADAKVQKFDIDLCDDTGRVAVRLQGFSARRLTSSPATQTLLVIPQWRDAEASQGGATEFAKHLVYAVESVSTTELAAVLPDAEYRQVGSAQAISATGYQRLAAELYDELQQLISSRLTKPVLLQVVVPPSAAGESLYGGIAGLLKTAQGENPKLTCQAITWTASHSGKSLPEVLLENRSQPDADEIRYVDGQRQVSRWHVLEVRQVPSHPWRDHGVYLLTGGVGGLGLIFAQDIVAHTQQATLILTGRSVLSEEQEVHLSKLRERGAQVVYERVDVTEPESVKGLMTTVVQRYGGLHGILHGAGVIRDSYIRNKNLSDVDVVLGPKVCGLEYLDTSSQAQELDFLVAFSSIAGALGNPGQGDYAAGNSFMDHYMIQRREWVKQGNRHGKSVSINWPLWRSGGMQLDKNTESHMMKSTGLSILESRAGIEAFYQVMAASDERNGPSQCLVLHGNPTKMREVLLKQTPEEQKVRQVVTRIKSEKQAEVAVSAIKVPSTETAIDVVILARQVESLLTIRIAEQLKLPKEEIEADIEWNELGYESVRLTEFAEGVSNDFGIELVPTLFFEYPTLSSFVGYLVEEHKSNLERYFGGRASAKVENTKRATAKTEVAIQHAPVASRKSGDMPKPLSILSRNPITVASSPISPRLNEPVAIVGISGCFPMAADVDAFWDNLFAGRDCIREIPKARWDWEAVHGDPATEDNKTNCKWGGFIEGVDQFDPLFFGISPREAELMDPQQRLLMMHVWRCVEDAGYAPSSLSGSKIAILVGTSVSGYNDLVTRAGTPITVSTAMSMSPSIGPNRMSYFLNLHGPSEPIETACSSALVAIHRGVKMVQSGEAEAAIVGGVNTLVTPGGHIGFSKAGMLSPNGRCKTFSDQADGYVRGEGVGMFMLKPLHAAEANGDHIYGVVRGSAENHGGRATSLTAPNTKAQAALLVDAYTQAGIDPSTVTYIEAHGTGTALGDPVEINGLKNAFSSLLSDNVSSSKEPQRCGLGSVKTNIGHLELAAGAAGLMKVLMQLKHKTLVRNLHSEAINPYIKLEDSPFYVVQQNQPWQAMLDRQGKEIPRRAGVSSFGYGGVNAHVVVEEYVPSSFARVISESSALPQALIVLSAKNQKQLRVQISNLLAAIHSGRYNNVNMADIAYTLQVGRDAMDERIGFVAESLGEMESTLCALLDNPSSGSLPNGVNVFSGNAKQNKNILSAFENDEELQGIFKQWIKRGEYTRLLDLWTQGLNVEWTHLYSEGQRRRRVKLPTYAFDLQSYWPSTQKKPAQTIASTTAAGANPEQKEESEEKVEIAVDNKMDTAKQLPVIKPLLHRDISTAFKTSFTSEFSGEEFFLNDYQLQGHKILPSVCYLEIVCESLQQGFGESYEDLVDTTYWHIRLTDNAWLQSLDVDRPQQITTHLLPHKDQSIHCIVFGLDENDDEHIYFRGKAELIKSSNVTHVNVGDLLDDCDTESLGTSDVYRYFSSIGLEYGSGLQSIEGLYHGLDGVNQPYCIAKVCLPKAVHNQWRQFSVHPSLFDSALQISLRLQGINEIGERESLLPLSLDALDVYARCTENMWVWARYSDESYDRQSESKFNISLMDEKGIVCAVLSGLTYKKVAAIAAIDLNKKEDEVENVEVEEILVTEGNFFDGGEPKKDSIVVKDIHDFSSDELAKAVQGVLISMASVQLKIPEDDIDADLELSEYGFDSISFNEFSQKICSTFDIDLSPTIFLEYPDLEAFGAFLVREYNAEVKSILKRKFKNGHGGKQHNQGYPTFS
ncbi:SDR family NAD(P)-dependent oxidoreductase [Cellvibrio sp. QJXJ]|uniref:SDR family NAD(P)-dependent oxidoreductase n=1 Tax=Cellvibrio sp. QJXJ TaxID=2964606 RepID=UPI0021C4BE65|nr:SDR family NAD(P)-dependent oxidoreductase [Cellvibrio sp. QJXJ]UUA73398.1 SDR family NAD(P)-dependent oxidoreductase [Cellvibrio sp. QJXJ]